MPTYQQVFRFRMTAQEWLSKDPSHASASNRFGYALARMIQRTDKIVEDYENAAEDARIANCVVDEKQVIQREVTGAYKFTVDGMNRANTTIRKLFVSDVEIKPYYATDTPNNLTALEVVAFTGFVLRETEELDTE